MCRLFRNPCQVLGPSGVVLLLTALPLQLAGQAIRGLISDTTTNLSVQGARVAMLDRSGDTVTTVFSGRDGAFLAIAPGWGRYIISIVHLGFEPIVTAPLKLFPADTVEISYQMNPLALLMDPVIVEEYAAIRLAHVRYLQDEGFFDRQRRTHGRFLDPAKIEQQRRFAHSADDYLQGQPNVSRGRRLVLDCGRPKLWIDGNPLLFAGRLADGGESVTSGATPISSFINEGRL